ncbi:MAG: hypothetical protein ACTH2Q_18885 [Propionibacteriaceae bacterium]
MEAIEVARTVADAYAREGDVAAVLVAGSLGRGRADAHSDVEVDVYWRRPPGDDERRRAVAATGGELRRLWPHEPDEGEWSEDLDVEQHDVTVSGFTADWLEATIATRAEFDLLAQLRLSAIHEGEVLVGAAAVQRWRRDATYSDALVAATVEHYRDAAPSHSWRQWPALVERGDGVPVLGLCAEMITSTLGMLSGINRVYVSHPRFKWAAALIERFEVAPRSLQGRLATALDAGVAELAATVDALHHETLELVRTEPGS